MLSKEHPDTAATTGYTSADDNMSGGAMELSALDTLFDQGRVRVMGDIPDVKLIANNMIQNYGLEEAFFVCDLGEVIKKHLEWIQFLPRVRPFYAVKCNDSPLVLETLAGLGTGFDCASKVEMQKVLGITGVAPHDIIYANPAKPRSHIMAAEELGVSTVTFDSKVELYKLKKLFPDAKLVVRIRCEASEAQCPLGMKFGVSVSEATELLGIAKDLGMDVVGVSFHVGSGCRDPPVFLRAIAEARLLFDYAEEIGYSLTLLDIGGGFPGNTGTSLQDIALVVNTALDRFFPEGCGTEIIAEPGRFYVASAFTLVAQIHSIREVRPADPSVMGEENRYMYYINDGIYGSFNCLMYDHHVVFPTLLEADPIRESEPKFECSIWGPTCDGLDQVCGSEYLPKMEVGEWLAFHDMGAYTLVAGGTFNGFPMPKLCTVASPEAWKILSEFIPSAKAFVVEDVPVFLKSGVGYNRDAVGWGCVELAVDSGASAAESSSASSEQVDGQSNQASSDDDNTEQVIIVPVSGGEEELDSEEDSSSAE